MTGKLLSIEQAYTAMFVFLEGVHSRTGADGLAELLGSMALLPDDSPADPAVWPDWREAVERSSSGAVDLSLNLTS